ncbi:MAG: hypothetical protein MKZ58_01910 [Candidatus Poseidoniaceae archaeon]|nr:hypothetical protein [Candidatus Poseidoniaceae archaeon]
MSKNGGSKSSFIISFVCFILAYIIKITIVDRDPDTYIGPPPVLAFFGGVILTLIGLVMAFLGIAKRTGIINQPDNSDIFR